MFYNKKIADFDVGEMYCSLKLPFRLLREKRKDTERKLQYDLQQTADWNS